VIRFINKNISRQLNNPLLWGYEKECPPIAEECGESIKVQ
jgi:hypothetical protein